MHKVYYYKFIPLALLTLTSYSAHAMEQDTIVVTASGFNQKIQNAPASISVISQQQLVDKSYRDITDAIKDIPGVVITGGGSRSDISIRGMGSQYTLILVDGKKINTRATRPNSDGPGMEQGWSPPLQSIERIEVIRGPMSSLYGSDAMGGVINIITKKTSTHQDWLGSLKTDVTVQKNRDSGDIRQANAYLAGPLIKDLLGAKLTGLISQRSEDKILNGYNGQGIRNGSIALNLTPNDNNDIEFEFNKVQQDRNSTPGYSTALLNCRKSKCVPNTASNVRYERTTYSLSHDGHYEFGNSKSYILYEDTNNPTRKMHAYNTTINNQNQFYLDDHNVTLGGQYNIEELQDQGNQRTNSDKKPLADKLTRWSWALFAEDSWDMVDNLTLTSGIRLDRDENYGSNLTPRVYGVWNLSEQWILKGGLSTGYRSPNLRQSSANWGQITGGGKTSIIVGKPEKSVSEEISLLWDNQTGINLGMTIFNTDFKNKIMESRRCNSENQSCVLDGNRYYFISDLINIDKANIRGLELTFDWQVNPDLRLSSNYTFTKSEQKSGPFTGKALNKIPKHMANLTLDWQPMEPLGFWSRINFQGKTSEYVGRTRMNEGTGSYTFVDLGVRYSFNKNIAVNSGIYNIFDGKSITAVMKKC